MGGLRALPPGVAADVCVGGGGAGGVLGNESRAQATSSDQAPHMTTPSLPSSPSSPFSPQCTPMRPAGGSEVRNVLISSHVLIYELMVRHVNCVADVNSDVNYRQRSFVFYRST